MADAATQIEQLRKYRCKPQRDLTVTHLIKSVAGAAQKTQRKLGALIDLWEQHVPPQLASHTAITGLRGGTLHVAVDGSATSFELDRLLREGLEQTLRSEYRGTLARVRIKIAPELFTQ